MNSPHIQILSIFTNFSLLLSIISCSAPRSPSFEAVIITPITKNDSEFDGDRAFSHIEHQLSQGPRTPGSPGHAKIVRWIHTTLQNNNWLAEIQVGESLGHPINNVVGKRGDGDPWIIIGAHFDTRMHADNDPDPAKRKEPVPGANDGASGTAVLLELSRVIPAEYPGTIWLVFFDAEDNGRIEGWDWILGSRYFVGELEGKPNAMVLLDMIGDEDLNIHIEKYSDPYLVTEIWDAASDLGYDDNFLPTTKHSILDDHIPFLQAGIPAVDIIDFDYPYYHTVADTLDKVSAESLKIVGDTILYWLDSIVP